MGSILRRARKRKRRLGEVEVVSRAEYAGLELDAKVELKAALRRDWLMSSETQRAGHAKLH